jgi:hypothetical protein
LERVALVEITLKDKMAQTLFSTPSHLPEAAVEARQSVLETPGDLAEGQMQGVEAGPQEHQDRAIAAVQAGHIRPITPEGAEEARRRLAEADQERL